EPSGQTKATFGNITVMVLKKLKPTTIAIEPEMDALLSVAARDHGVSRSEFIRQHLGWILEQYREHPRPRSAGVVRGPLRQRGNEVETFRGGRRGRTASSDATSRARNPRKPGTSSIRRSSSRGASTARVTGK